MQALKALSANPYPDPSHPLPKPIIVGGGAMMVAAVAFCALAHATGIGVSTSPTPAPLASRDLVFTERDDGVLAIKDANHRLVERIAPGEAGFIRAMVRGLTRNRTRYGEPAVGAFRVSVERDGGVWLQDLGTRQNIDLRAFGPTQVQAFAQLLSAREVTP